MTISRSAVRQLLRVMPPARLSRSMLAALMIGTGLGSLSLTAHVRATRTPVHETRTPVHELRNIPPGDAIVPQAPYASSAAFDPKYRLGFLEFEDAIE